MDAAALPPPAIVQPAPRQVSYGLVTGQAARGTRWVIVSANGRALLTKEVRGRRLSLRVNLPTGDLALRVTTVHDDGRRSSRTVHNVFGLPSAARPRVVRAMNDAVLAREFRRLAMRYRGTAGVYVQSLTSGVGAAWNAKARFPAASTLKVAIAATVLAAHRGIPSPSSRLHALLREMIVPSDDQAANDLLVWIGGSTSSGALRVNALLRSIGIRDSVMYGGYLVRTLSGPIPVRVEEQPAFGVGKYTTARDMTSLLRAVWLASAGKGPLRTSRPGLTPEDARYLLWLLAHVDDTPKLDRWVERARDVTVLHKAGWINAARHDTGLVFWRGGVFVVAVMTWRASGASVSSDVLASRIAVVGLERVRALARRKT